MPLRLLVEPGRVGGQLGEECPREDLLIELLRVRVRVRVRLRLRLRVRLRVRVRVRLSSRP